jgi:hypothetical protein
MTLKELTAASADNTAMAVATATAAAAATAAATAEAAAAAHEQTSGEGGDDTLAGQLVGRGSRASSVASVASVASGSGVVFSSGEDVNFKPGAVDAKYGPTATIHDGTVSEGNQIQVCLGDGRYLWVDLGGIQKRCELIQQDGVGRSRSSSKASGTGGSTRPGSEDGGEQSRDESRGNSSASEKGGRPKLPKIPAPTLAPIRHSSAAVSTPSARFLSGYVTPYDRYSLEFEEQSMLGSGGFGTVYACKNRLLDEDYAIKKVLMSSSEGEKTIERDLREVRVIAFHGPACTPFLTLLSPLVLSLRCAS